MIWTAFSTAKFSGEYNFAEGMWRKQRNLVRLKRTSGTGVVNVALSIGFNFDVEFDTNGNLLIDLTDFVADVPNMGIFAATISYDGTEIQLSSVIMGDIAAENLIIPISSEIQKNIPIIPPRKMYEPLFGLYTIAAVRNVDSMGYKLVPMASPIILGAGYHEINIPLKYLYIESGGNSMTYSLKSLSCGRKYAMVQWVGACGYLKRHTFEVVRVSNSGNNSVTLQNNYGIGKTLKDTEQEFTLRIDKLQPYDFWYYSDLVTSNDVRVCVEEHDADFGDETLVDVLTKSIVIPDRGVADFEVKIKFREYVTI